MGLYFRMMLSTTIIFMTVFGFFWLIGDLILFAGSFLGGPSFFTTYLIPITIMELLFVGEFSSCQFVESSY